MCVSSDVSQRSTVNAASRAEDQRQARLALSEPPSRQQTEATRTARDQMRPERTSNGRAALDTSRLDEPWRKTRRRTHYNLRLDDRCTVTDR